MRQSLLALAGVMVVVVAAGCSSDPAGRVARAGDLGHIHDLVETDDGTLLAATHAGLYRIDDPDTAVLVGTEQHDLMSMAATGDTLFASGHPDLRLAQYRVEGLPAHLGLAESADGGRTWDIDPELLGKRDFHAPLPTERGIYAAGTEGRISLRLPDGTWTELGDLNARDLAVDPADKDHFVATDDHAGIWHSTDAGRSWAAITDAPPLIEVEWLESGRLVAADEHGTIWTSTAPSGPWTETAAAPNDVETLHVDDGRWMVAGHGGSIHLSTDDGTSWRAVHIPPPR